VYPLQITFQFTVLCFDIYIDIALLQSGAFCVTAKENGKPDIRVLLDTLNDGSQTGIRMEHPGEPVQFHDHDVRSRLKCVFYEIHLVFSLFPVIDNIVT